MFYIKVISRKDIRKDDTRTNGNIRAKEVRLIGEEGEQLGVVPTAEALVKAQSAELDLVEISPNATPPVCKIMDYGKFKYEKSKLDKENKKKQKQTVTKELRIKPHIDIHDKETKMAQIEKFLEKEYKVKVSLRLAGREKMHTDLSLKLLDEFAAHFEDKVTVEKKYGKEQVQKFIILSPKK